MVPRNHALQTDARTNDRNKFCYCGFCGHFMRMSHRFPNHCEDYHCAWGGKDRAFTIQAGELCVFAYFGWSAPLVKSGKGKNDRDWKRFQEKRTPRSLTRDQKLQMARDLPRAYHFVFGTIGTNPLYDGRRKRFAPVPDEHADEKAGKLIPTELLRFRYKAKYFKPTQH